MFTYAHSSEIFAALVKWDLASDAERSEWSDDEIRDAAEEFVGSVATAIAEAPPAALLKVLVQLDLADADCAWSDEKIRDAASDEYVGVTSIAPLSPEDASTLAAFANAAK